MRLAVTISFIYLRIALHICVIFFLFAFFPVQILAARTWIGAGAGGAGTDFNTAANWTGAGALLSTDDLTITATTGAIITVSTSVTVNSITMLNKIAVINARLKLNAQTFVLTVNGNVTADTDPTADASTLLKLQVGNSPGLFKILGNCNLGTNGWTAGGVCISGGLEANVTGIFEFDGNLTVGYNAACGLGDVAVLFDKNGAQTFTNNSVMFGGTYDFLFTNTVTIGSVNNPTVTVTASVGATSQGIGLYDLAAVRNVTVNGTSVLDLGVYRCDELAGGVAGSVFTLAAGATLKLAGVATSNFPLGFTTYTLNGTVEYNAAGAQTITKTSSAAFPAVTYTNLIISGAGGNTKTLGIATTVNGALTVRANTVLALSTFNLGSPTSTTIETLGGGVGSSITGTTGLFTLGGNVTLNYTGAGAITTGATISSLVALTNATNRTFTVADDGTANSDLTISGVISTTGALTKAGAGTLTLSGVNTFIGGATLNAGTLNINNAQALGTVAGTFIINGGTIDNTTGGAITTLNYPQTWGGDFTFTGTQNLNLGTGAVSMGNANRQITTTTVGKTLTIGGTISSVGPRTLTKAGAGTLTLTGVNTFTGGTTLTAGVLNINNAQALGTVVGTFIINGGTIDNTTGGLITTRNYPQTWGGDFTFTGTQNLNLGTGAVTMGASRQVTITANTLTVRGIINNNAQNLTKAGAGTLAFVNQAITLNALTISAGTLISTSGTLNLSGDFSNSGTFTHNSGTVTFTGSAAGQNITGTSSTTFYNLTFSNTYATLPQISLGAANDVTVANTLSMGSNDIINLNGRTLTLGTAVGTPGTLTYANGFMYGGTFTRWISATAAAMGAIASNELGHFPMGTVQGSYRPLWIAYPVTNLSAGGTVSVVHNPTFPPGTVVASHVDGSWAGGTTLQGVSNSTWVISTANGFAFNAVNNGAVRYGGIGFSTFTLTDLDASLAASVVGTYGASTSVNTPLEVNRTALTTANLANIWRIGTKNVSASPLPIELLSFDAKRNESKVDLKWITATEINNDFFTIEKSTDGNNFEFVSAVKGAGNSTSILNYTSFDNAPYEGLSYYRLKQTDYDGTHTYSNLVAVEFKNSTDFIFIVYPNPGNGENTQLLITGNKGKEVLVVVYDVTAKESFSKVIITRNDGNNVYAIDPSNKLSSGIYMITATSNQDIYSAKLIITPQY